MRKILAVAAAFAGVSSFWLVAHSEEIGLSASKTIGNGAIVAPPAGENGASGASRVETSNEASTTAENAIAAAPNGGIELLASKIIGNGMIAVPYPKTFEPAGMTPVGSTRFVSQSDGAPLFASKIIGNGFVSADDWDLSKKQGD
jgi:hypothetical protein